MRPLSALRNFTCMETLSVPKVALLQARQAERAEAHIDVPATLCLPKALRSQVISQVDMATRQWTQNMLKSSNEQFPDLKDIRLIFQENVMPMCPSDFEETIRKSGVSVIKQWKDLEYLKFVSFVGYIIATSQFIINSKLINAIDIAMPAAPVKSMAKNLVSISVSMKMIGDTSEAPE
ncbi:hypothetical protein E8E11_007144 [Didymella keratinophila]|nr:hypothetical protein E8E11_007144 [Didymella keratinophila]